MLARLLRKVARWLDPPPPPRTNIGALSVYCDNVDAMECPYIEDVCADLDDRGTTGRIGPRKKVVEHVK